MKSDMRWASGTSSLESWASVNWGTRRSPRAEQYHAQLAYEVGRGHEYCGWPFQRSCATPKRVPRTLGVARVVID